MGDAALALRTFHRALRWLSARPAFPEIPSAGETFLYIGMANRRRGEDEEALEALTAARDIFRHAGSEDIKFAETLNEIGEIRETQGFEKEATACFKDSIRVFKSVVGKPSDARIGGETETRRERSLSFSEVQIALISEQARIALDLGDD
mmetsp:Transcript_40619/g.95380  ORF Transcript_40619/g.95380 Transcript_40619/m.95380 type:complete len:150 (-) Transcript_40619:398-847(-)